MLVSRRSVAAEVGAVRASVGTVALAHAAYRVHFVRNYNVTCDDALFLPSVQRMGHVSRPVLTAILRGTARVRAGAFDRWLAPGDVVVFPEKGAISMRQQPDDVGRFESVAIEWTPGTIGLRPHDVSCGSLDASTLARVELIARELTCGAVRGAAAVSLRVAELLASLRVWGVPFNSTEPSALVEDVAEPVLRLSWALDEALSKLGQSPMLVDLHGALGISERQLHRLVGNFNRRYGFNSGGWRDTVSRRRLLVGASFMTAPGARTEDVAGSLGYASPTSFCHALASAGLPSPGSIAAIVTRLE